VRSLPVFHGLFILIHTVVHAVVYYFYLLFRNCSIHTLTSVFEVTMTFKPQL
jgi:hypothetical protein